MQAKWSIMSHCLFPETKFIGSSPISYEQKEPSMKNNAPNGTNTVFRAGKGQKHQGLVEFMLIYNETGLGRDQVKIWFCHHELAELLITTQPYHCEYVEYCWIILFLHQFDTFENDQVNTFSNHSGLKYLYSCHL